MFYRGDNELDPANHSMNFIRQIGYHKHHNFGDITDIEFAKSLYAGGVRYVDSELQELFALMEKLGIFDNTLIILVSDHGESLFEHHVYIGHGMFLHDTEVKIPLIMKLPKDRYAGTRVPEQVQSIDIMPTLFDMLNLSGPKEMQGLSLLESVEQPTVPRSESYAYGETPNLPGTAFVRTNRWKYISPLTISPESIGETLQASDRVDLRPYIVVEEQLYDLEQDPGEVNNVAAKERAMTARLRERLNAWTADNRKQRALFDHEHRSRPKKGEVTLSEEEREHLKALGYVE